MFGLVKPRRAISHLTHLGDWQATQFRKRVDDWWITRLQLSQDDGNSNAEGGMRFGLQCTQSLLNGSQC